MTEYITVERNHPDYIKYLTGEFSKEHCAIPVRSLNTSKGHENVTFQLVKRSEIVKPSWFKILIQILRLDLLTLTLTPAVVVAFFIGTEASLQVSALTLISLFFLHGAVFCRNDYVDHMHGADRSNEKGGSQVIQQGWLAAVVVKRIYWVLMILSVLFAAPVMYLRPELLLLCGAVAVLGVFGYSHLRWARGHWVWGDLAIWLCLGPLLTCGMAWALLGEVSYAAFWIGAYFGTLALAYVEVRHTISMVVDDEAGLKTLPTRLGFDHAKTVIVSLFVIAGVIAVWSGELMVTLVGLNFWLALKGFQVASPLSSKLYEMPKRVIFIHFLSGLLFLVQNFIISNSIEP